MPERNGSPDDTSTAALQADIDRTRTELGDTAEALAAKLDVKKQVRTRTEPLRRNAVPIGAGVGAVVLLLLIRRRRRVRQSRSR